MRDGETWKDFHSRRFRFYEAHCNEIYELAKQAIELRRQGERKYIRLFFGRPSELE